MLLWRRSYRSWTPMYAIVYVRCAIDASMRPCRMYSSVVSFLSMAMIFTLPPFPTSFTATAHPSPPAASTQANPARSGYACRIERATFSASAESAWSFPVLTIEIPGYRARASRHPRARPPRFDCPGIIRRATSPFPPIALRAARRSATLRCSCPSRCRYTACSGDHRCRCR